jgi:hypothetical protein
MRKNSQGSNNVKREMEAGIIPYAGSLEFGFPSSFIHLLENILEPVNKSTIQISMLWSGKGTISII